MSKSIYEVVQDLTDRLLKLEQAVGVPVQEGPAANEQQTQPVDAGPQPQQQ